MFNRVFSFLNLLIFGFTLYPAGIYLLKVTKGNTKIACVICSKLTIKTSERLQQRRPGVFIASFEQIS